jgi:SAM-dependent methyltransferase
MDEFTQFERAAWDEKAARFSDTWGRVTQLSIPLVLQVCRIGPGIRALDIGCGTGELAAAIQSAGASVVAVDASASMCSIAQAKYPTIRFLQSDAERLPCDDQEFDVACLNYLLLHVSNQELVLREAARTIKRRGTLCWTNWIAPPESVGLSIIFSALKDFADFSVIPPAPDIFQFSNQEVSGVLLSSLGFGRVNCAIAPTEWRIKSGDEFFQAIQSGTRIGGLIDLQKVEVKSKLKEVISRAVEGYRKGEHCVIPMPTHIFTATREN